MGQRIRSLREGKKLGLRELARLAGLSPSFLSEIESGRSYPSEPALEALAKEIGVTGAELRELDMRPQLSGLRDLLQADPSWGPVFRQLVDSAKCGSLNPDKLLKKLQGK